jgi:hypothetical protein
MQSPGYQSIHHERQSYFSCRGFEQEAGMSKILKLEMISKMVSAEIEIRFPDVNGNYMAQINGVSVKDGKFLSGKVGRADNPVGAMENYFDQIRGKRIVVNPASEMRIELNIPEDM